MQSRLRHPLEMMMWTRTWQLIWAGRSVLGNLPCPRSTHPHPSKMQSLSVSFSISISKRNLCQMTRIWPCPPSCHHQQVLARCCVVSLGFGRMSVTSMYSTMQVLRIWGTRLLLRPPRQSRTQASQQERQRLIRSRAWRSHGDLADVTSLKPLEQWYICYPQHLPARGQGTF